MIIWLVLASALLLLLGGAWWERRQYQKRLHDLITIEGDGADDARIRAVIDAGRFDQSLKRRLLNQYYNYLELLSPQPVLKVGLFAVVTSTALYFLDSTFLRQGVAVVVPLGLPVLGLLALFKLKQHRVNKFKDDFPDALNILSGALGAGQSIVHAFEYVGQQMDNDVGREFQSMAERLLIGEDPDDVLARSGNKFPYVEYFFFISTIRLNLSRGGQLKAIINRINRIMFDARAMDKKKSALTSEARSSAKIVAALPVIFLVILRVTSPENFNFVMFEEGGRPIFYYVLCSEIFGFFCISMIMRGVD